MVFIRMMHFVPTVVLYKCRALDSCRMRALDSYCRMLHLIPAVFCYTWILLSSATLDSCCRILHLIPAVVCFTWFLLSYATLDSYCRMLHLILSVVLNICMRHLRSGDKPGKRLSNLTGTRDKQATFELYRHEFPRISTSSFLCAFFLRFCSFFG
jgi:hypothetical protein